MPTIGLKFRIWLMESTMAELFRSGAIVVMGLTVMAAGIFVVFYG